MYFFLFYIFTSCVVTYSTVRKHNFRQHFIWNFHENHIPFFAFLPIQIPERVCMGDTENHYETCLWFAVDFNNLKFISSTSGNAFEITCSCIFSRAVYDLFSMCFVLCTYNKYFFFFFFFFFFYKYSLKCMALFFFLSLLMIRFFFFFFFFYCCCFFFSWMFTEMHGSFSWHSRRVQLQFPKRQRNV